MLQEEPPNVGERIERHAVGAWIDGEWKEITEYTNVGYRRILRFPDVTTDKIRIRILESCLTPSLATVKAYYYNARPPQLQASRTIDGVVSLYPKKSDFKWKNGLKDALKNLSMGTVIHYTTDGSEPTLDSPIFSEPFIFENGVVKALAELNGETGPVLTQVFGKIKNGWEVIDTKSSRDRYKPSLAIDADPATFWASDTTNLTFTIDLQKKQKVSDLVYTPQSSIYGEGMIEKGDVEVSDDGKKWKKVGTFEFGNLINDPTPRTYEFAKPQTARYIRIVPLTIAGTSKVAMISEIDIL